MWDEKALKIIPALLFLFCILEIFELGLIVNEMDKAEKLEVKLTQNLEELEKITNLLNEHLEGMVLQHSRDKRIKSNKQCNSI